jgi:TonB family protein
VIVFFGEKVSFAQTNSCAVKLEVTKTESNTEIKGATATAVNSETKRVYRSKLNGGMPFFVKLPEGEYRVTVTKTGFYRSADDFTLDCSEDENSWSIELYQGNPKQIVKLYNRKKYVVGLMRAPAMENSSVAVAPTQNVPEDDEPILQPAPNPKPTPPPVPKIVAGGVVNGKATNLVKPQYPAAARAVNASGAVNVQVTIDEEGNVISASAVSGHPLLRAAAVKAARESKFSPTRLSGQPVKVTGVIVYNFVP